MHLIITDPKLARSRSFHVGSGQLVAVILGAVLSLMGLSLLVYHLVFLHGAREGWPVIAPLARWMSSAERENQERYMRENLDAMAVKLGEMQARVVQLDALAERVASLAGVPPNETRLPSGTGGHLVLPRSLTMEEFNANLEQLSERALSSGDHFGMLESKLFEDKVRKAMLPTEAPVRDVKAGSGFGWRIDPFTGQRALHTGLDFASDPGTPIIAAAGGVVITQEFHPAYGHMVEIDHGNDLVTRYAHASKVWVKVGDVVKRGQRIAEVGTSGRSTGPHLHFEVWVAGVAQDPQRFLDAGQVAQRSSLAARKSAGR